MSSEALTIGRLAKSANVNVETVRYYQRVGLIKEPPKPPAGYRVYTGDTINRIRFIKRAQQLGFTLHEITELLAHSVTVIAPMCGNAPSENAARLTRRFVT
jgi:MerR family mercuric resistance operon transcriptional regulator